MSVARLRVRRPRSRLSTVLPILATLLAGLAVNLWAARCDRRFDLTDHGVYSLASESLAVAETIDQPVAITFFYDARSRAMRDARDLLERLAAASARIELRVADPAHEPALAERHGVRFAGTTVFESAGRTITTHGATETEFVNGLIRVTHTAAQRVCVTTGHVESDPHSLESHDHAEGEGTGHHHHGDHSSGGRPLRIHERHGLGMARRALATLGYEIAVTPLVRGAEPLANCSVLLVASPQVPFATREVRHIEAFFEAGGAGLLLLEPGISTGLEPLLSQYGISISKESVRDPVEHYGTDERSPAVTNYPRHRLTRNLPLTFFPGAASLSPTPHGSPDVVLTPLILTSSDAQVASGAPGRQALWVYAIRRQEGEETRLLVAGDGDFVTNSYFHILGNGQLFLNAVNLLAENEELIDIAPRHYQEARLELTNRQMLMTFFVATVALPSLLLVMGWVAWWRGR